MVETGFALFAVALIMAKLGGPFWMFDCVRKYIKTIPKYGKKLHEGASCQFCIGFWLVVGLSLYKGDLPNSFFNLLPALGIAYLLGLIADFVIEFVTYHKYMRLGDD